MRNDERDAAPRLNPRLSPKQLWMMANEPDWRPWMILIVNHRNAWPELRAWYAAASRDGFDAAGPAPDPPDARTGPFARLLLPPTPTAPLPPDDTAGHGEPDPEEAGARSVARPEPEHAGTPVDDLAAVADTAGPATARIPAKPVMIGVAAALAAVVLVAGGTAAWDRIGHVRAERAEQAAVQAAREDCARASKSLRVAMNEYNTLKNGKAADMARITAKQVEDQKTVATLAEALEAKEPKAMACAADTRAGYERRTGRVESNRAWYAKHKASLARAVKAVEESRDAKTIADAAKLLKDSKGKVADEKTRTELDKAIKANDTDAVAKAVKAVNDSVKAKEKADAQARAKEKAEAEAREQARRGNGSSGSVTQPGYSAGGYSPATGSAGSGSAPSQSAPSTPSTPSQSAPSWDVPATGGQDGLPDKDPSM